MTVIGHIVVEGYSLNHGKAIEEFSIGQYVHGYAFGSSGTGKSTLLKKLAIEQMQSSNGLLFIDPLGVNSPDLLNYVPQKRRADVIYIHPSDKEYSLLYNPLENAKNSARTAKALTTAFTRGAGDTITTTTINVILTNSILAMIERGGTLTSTLRFMMDKDFRTEKIRKLSPDLRKKWRGIYDTYDMRSRPFQSSVSRVSALLDSPEMNEIFKRPRGKFHMDEAVDKGKIIIVNGDPGVVGEEASNLFTSIIFDQFIVSCQRKVLEIPFLAIGDEVQNYVTEADSKALSYVRNYNVKLMLAHQYRNQIKDESTRSALMANADLKFIFRIPEDAKEVADKFMIPINKLTNLPNFEAYVLHDNDYDKVRMASLRLSESHRRRQDVINKSREQFCRKRL